METIATNRTAQTALGAFTLGTALALTAFPVLTIPGIAVFSGVVWRLVRLG